MNNPLTPDQIQRINEIAKLSKEQQKIEFQKLLQELTPEQLEFLKKQAMPQQGECIFCSIIKNKIPSKKVYEDESVLVILDINPANLGHILIIPKNHVPSLFKMDSLTHIFSIVHRLANLMVERLNAGGINLFIADGQLAGQKIDHALIHLIPRYGDDKLDFTWQPKQVTEEQLNEVLEKLQIVYKKIEEDKQLKVPEPEQESEEEFEWEEPDRIP